MFLLYPISILFSYFFLFTSVRNIASYNILFFATFVLMWELFMPKGLFKIDFGGT